MAPRCRWLVDKKTGLKYHVPECWGGVHNPLGCYCDRSESGWEAYEREDVDDEFDKLRDRVEELEKQVAALKSSSTVLG
jgi:hypothetical protein